MIDGLNILLDAGSAGPHWARAGQMYPQNPQFFSLPCKEMGFVRLKYSRNGWDYENLAASLSAWRPALH